MSFVRQSKVRHVFGTVERAENCYSQVLGTQSSWDSNYIKVNHKFLAVIWQGLGGGLVGVIPVERTGRVPTDTPLVAGHTRPVLDLEWNPFNENILATTAEDCNLNIWRIPDGGLTENLTTPAVQLSGFSKKVGYLKFHPTAANVLLSLSTDSTIRLWDIEKAQERLSLNLHKNPVSDIAWNVDGSVFASQSPRDKTVRIIDPRANAVAQQAPGHAGIKPARLLWMHKRNWICSVGFGRQSERQALIWDPRNFGTPLCTENMDQAPGVCIPFMDEDTNVLFFCGKGDASVRYYEVVDSSPYLYYINTFRGGDAQRGLDSLHKKYLNTHECEIARFFKLTNQNNVEIVHFNVPRRTEVFQDDLYPETYDVAPVLTADEWYSGMNRDRPMIRITPDMVPETHTATFTASGVSGSATPSAPPTTTTTTTAEPPSRPSPTPSPSAPRRPTPSTAPHPAPAKPEPKVDHTAELQHQLDEAHAEIDTLKARLHDAEAHSADLERSVEDLRALVDSLRAAPHVAEPEPVEEPIPTEAEPEPVPEPEPSQQAVVEPDAQPEPEPVQEPLMTSEPEAPVATPDEPPL